MKMALRSRIPRLSLLWIAFFCSLLIPQFAGAIDEDTIARINNRKIGFREFYNRLNALPNTLKIPENEIKETLVSTLIAETILSSEALKERLDTVEQVRLMLNQHAGESIYEQWMDSEVRSRITVTESELRSAYRRFTERRSVAFWVLPDPREAASLRDSIANGSSPAIQPQFKEIDYAESLESVENEVFRLKAGEVSKPVPVNGSYYVFQLLKRGQHPEHSKQNFMFWRPSVEKRVRARKEASLVATKIDVLMRGKKYSISRDAYDFLVGQLSSTIFDQDTSGLEPPDRIQQKISGKDVEPRSFFDRPLITFNDGANWTVKGFWQKLSVCPYPLNYKSAEDLKKGLVEVARSIILFESIVADGKKKGYDRSASSRSDSQMWGNNVLAQALVQQCQRSVTVSEKDLMQYYDSVRNKYAQPELRRIIPIIVRGREVADRLREEIVHGADIASLAAEYSISNMHVAGAKAGIFISRHDWGAIGEVAFTLNVGQLSATFKNSDSTYAIVKLQEIKPSAPPAFDDVRSRLRGVFEREQLQQKLEGFLFRVVRNYDIKVDRTALKKVEYLGGTLAVRKSHFPLRSAVPGFLLFDPKAKWYTEGISKN